MMDFEKLPGGGPAFPCSIRNFDGDGKLTAPMCVGMTLRQWYAGQVLIGVMGSSDFQTFLRDAATRKFLPLKMLVSDLCFEQADAMLAFEEKEKPSDGH